VYSHSLNAQVTITWRTRTENAQIDHKNRHICWSAEI